MAVVKTLETECTISVLIYIHFSMSNFSGGKKIMKLSKQVGLVR